MAVLSDAATAPLAGWAAIPNFTAVRYGAQPGFPSTIVGAQVGGGSTFVVGGPANAQSEAIQQVDVSAQAQAIDAGRATMTLAGLLGGLSTDTDAGQVTGHVAVRCERSARQRHDRSGHGGRPRRADDAPAPLERRRRGRGNASDPRHRDSDENERRN